MKKIINSQVNIFFPKILNQREKFINNENILDDYFLKATIISLPEQIQEEVPRIIAQTKGGHSILSISLNRATFSTNYSGEYCDKWSLCEEYINNRIKKVNELVDKLSEGKKYFIGLTLVLKYEVLNETGLDIIKKNIFKDNKTLNDLYNSTCSFVFVENEKYYVNITLQNERKPISKNGKKINGELDNSIITTIDINDKYLWYETDNYNSDVKNLNSILKYVNNFVEKKLDNIVENGNFN